MSDTQLIVDFSLSLSALLKTLCVEGGSLGFGGTSEEAFWPHLDLEVPDRVASSGKA